MDILRLAGLFAIIPSTLLLTVSFLVLVVMRKVEEKGLRAFGFVVVALLWASALLVFSAGIYTLSTGRHPAVCLMQEMMKGKKQMMHQGRMPGMMPGQMDMMMPPAPEDMPKKDTGRR
jgi:hypothetical protein